MIFVAGFLIVVGLIDQLPGGERGLKSLRSVLSFFQIIGYFNGFSGLSWPPAVRSMLRILSFFVLNFQLAMPECQSRSLGSPFNRLVIVICIPLLVLLLLALFGLLRHVFRSVYQKAITRRSASGSDLNSRSRASEAGRPMSPPPPSPTSEFDRCFGAIMIFLSLFYILAGDSVLATFSCRDAGSGVSYLQVSPDIECFTDEEHWKMVWASGLAIPLLLIGTPALFALYVFRHRGHLLSPRYRLRVGFLTNRYRQSAVWWEALLMGQKMLLLSAQHYFPDLNISASLSLLVLLFGLLLHSGYHPNAENEEQVLEVLFQTVEVLTLWSGLLFGLESFSSGTPRDTLSVLVTLILAFACALGLALLARDVVKLVIEKFWSRRARRRLEDARDRLCECFAQSCPPEWRIIGVEWAMTAPYDDLVAVLDMFGVLAEDSSAIARLLPGLLKRRVRERSAFPSPSVVPASSSVAVPYHPGNGVPEVSLMFDAAVRGRLVEWLSSASTSSVRRFQTGSRVLREQVLSRWLGRDGECVPTEAVPLLRTVQGACEVLQTCRRVREATGSLTKELESAVRVAWERADHAASLLRGATAGGSSEPDPAGGPGQQG